MLGQLTFFSSHEVFQAQCVFHTCSTPQLRIATFQGPSVLIWLVATLLDGTDLDHALQFIDERSES